jgi:hypothetical protein
MLVLGWGPCISCISCTCKGVVAVQYHEMVEQVRNSNSTSERQERPGRQRQGRMCGPKVLG